MAEVRQTTQLPTILIILGVTGDLARRKLLPALFHLYHNKKLPDLFQVVGFSRRELSDEDFQKYVKEVIDETPGTPSEAVEAFSKLFTYQSGVFESKEGYDRLAERLGRQDEEWRTCANKLFYLAVPPEYYATIFQNLADSGLTEPCGPDEGWTRVIVEKPFGKDLATAQELDAMLGSLFKEEQIYRIDHYLGKDTVQNILAFRFSNSFLEPAWNRQSISNIRIQFLEKLGVEGRANFYDGVGALRDVGQNHMLQMLALFAMENPGSFTPDAIRKARTKVLEGLESMDVQDVTQRTVRARYKGYESLEGVQKGSETETYFQLQTYLNTDRWRGVPIYLESGKAMGESRVEITVTFRHQTPCMCPPNQHVTNVLRYRIQPNEGIFTSFWVKKPGSEMIIEERDFSFDYHRDYEDSEFIDAYAKLIADAVAGDQTLFVSTSEITASWKFIDPIIQAWQQGKISLKEYEVGSKGPSWPPEVKGKVLAKEIGYIGLGKMGTNMVERLQNHNWKVVAHDPVEEARQRVTTFGAEAVASVVDVVKKLEAPRVVWVMVPHAAVDQVVDEMLPHLDPGDTIIDGGNSYFKESIERAKKCEEKGIEYLDVGVSGGPGGAKAGACLMVGGKKDVYKKNLGLFGDLAAASGYDYMGSSGAGHFVKMVHNGIEYGMMQAIAEGFAVLKEYPDGLDLERVTHVYSHGSVIESRLIDWLKNAYREYGSELSEISGTISHSGEGAWTVKTAREFGIPVPIIEGSLQFRIDSEDTPSYTGQIVSALRNQFGGHDVRKKEN